MGVCSFPSAHVQLTKRTHMLMPAQPYRVRLVLDMPESPPNKELGIVCISLGPRIKPEASVTSATIKGRCFDKRGGLLGQILPYYRETILTVGTDFNF